MVLACSFQDKTPDAGSQCLLAEAYMTIQQPDKAAAAYEVWQVVLVLACAQLGQGASRGGAPRCLDRGRAVTPCTAQAALALRPKDADLAVSAAKAHVAAHDYSRAIDHYNRCAHCMTAA
jgi:Tfp pilus assembly protein PilF